MKVIRYISPGKQDAGETLIRLKKLLEHMRWKVEHESENEIVYKSPVTQTVWVEKIFVKFDGYDISVHGPKGWVEKAVERVN